MQMIFVNSSSTDEYLTKDKIYSGIQRSIGFITWKRNRRLAEPSTASPARVGTLLNELSGIVISCDRNSRKF